jgi:radical SAM-linked protein
MWNDMSVEVANDNPQDIAGRSAGLGEVTDAIAVVRFAIGGALRFLSHAETLRVFERACARASVPVKYTQGFNPHPRQSLPLPRSVGVAADDEWLVLRVFDAQGFPLGAEQDAARLAWQDQMQARLAGALVPGIDIHQVQLMPSNTSFHPVSAEYVFALTGVDGLSDKIAGLLAAEHLVVERIKPSRPEGRRIDVRPFLKSIRLDGMQTVAECGISDAGSVRVDEIMTLLEVTPADLAAPIRRTHVTWKTT